MADVFSLSKKIEKIAPIFVPANFEKKFKKLPKCFQGLNGS
jgi:hypothetical protein